MSGASIPPTLPGPSTPRGATTPPTEPGTITPLRLVATVCVLAPIVAVIAVPTYNSATPRLGGFPFFYWYQLLLVVVTGILMVSAFWAIKIDEGRRRRFRADADTGSASAHGSARAAGGEDEGDDA